MDDLLHYWNLVRHPQIRHYFEGAIRGHLNLFVCHLHLGHSIYAAHLTVAFCRPAGRVAPLCYI